MPATSRCPECPKSAAEFVPVAYNQLFCSKAHRIAFHNRNVTRGQALTPLAMAARLTRDGSAGDKATGVYARQESRRLIALYAAEDKKAGRMTMVEYIALRRSLGIYTKLDL